MQTPFDFSGMQSRTWAADGAFHCELTLPLRIGGTIKLLATVTSSELVARLRRAGLQIVPGKTGKTRRVLVQGAEVAEIELGSLFGAIGRAVSKVGKAAAIRKALKLGKSLINNPLVRIIAPQAAAAIEAASGAAKLVSAARGKDKAKAQKAKLALVAAKGQAEREKQAGRALPPPASVRNASPPARGAFRYLVTVAHAAA